ncbi:MAG: signal peptidase I, partial [Patescibacteria group bacterium]
MKFLGGAFKEILTFIILAIVIVVPIRLLVAQPFVVEGESMHPTFESGDYLIVDELTYRLSDPKRGDVVIFRYPKDPKVFYIKRIIGLPG